MQAFAEQDNDADRASFSSKFLNHELSFTGINIPRHLLLEFQTKLFEQIFQRLCTIHTNLKREELTVRWNEDKSLGSLSFLLTYIVVSAPKSIYMNEQQFRRIVAEVYRQCRADIRKREFEPVRRPIQNTQ
jgi:hypothetical protein